MRTGKCCDAKKLGCCSAMGGTVLFQDALRQRLNIMQTSRQKVQEFLAAHPPRISKGKAAGN